MGVTHSDSYIEKICYELRHKPLCQLTVENIRLLIGQGVALEYLMPAAIDILHDNPLVEGMHYKGDLLSNVLLAGPSCIKIIRV